MDAPPPHEDCRPFVTIARLLEDHGLQSPHLYALDIDQGFLLLSDFGDTTYLKALADKPADPLYREALSALVRLQSIQNPSVPAYTQDKLALEMELLPEWYLTQHLGRPLDPRDTAVWKTCTERILERCLNQGQVLVHRDFHSRNLMVTPQGPGILDFQDAVLGPITYDPVSLLRDAYVDFSEDQQMDWLVRWWTMARAKTLPVPEDFSVCYQDFEWMGVQRHLKVLGIFARLWHRDGKAQYLDSIPRVLRYTLKACDRYDELRPLGRLLADRAGLLGEGFSF